MVKEQALAHETVDATPKISEGVSSFVGWEQGAANSNNDSVVEKNRVGGVTFVINTTINTVGEELPDASLPKEEGTKSLLLDPQHEESKYHRKMKSHNNS